MSLIIWHWERFNACLYRCYSKLNEVENNPKEQAWERGHEDDKKKVPTACTVAVKIMGKQLKHEY